MKNFNRALILILFLLSGCSNFTRIDYTSYERGKSTQAIIKSGHQRAVGCLAVTTDSRFIITGSFDKTIKIWLADGTFVKSINTGAIVNAVAFNPYGNFIIAGLSDKTIQIWTFDGIKYRTVIGHNAEITSLDVEPGGGFFVSGSKDKTIKIWDPYGNLLNNIQAHDDAVSKIKVTSSFPFKEILSASWDGTIKIWSTWGALLSTIKEENSDGNYVESLAVSEDGQHIVAGYSDGIIKLFSRDGTLVKRFIGHTDYVKSLALTKNNQTIISGSADNSIIIWNTNGNIVKNLRNHKGIVRDIQLLPNGENFISASADDTIKIWYTNGYLVKTLSFQNSQISAIAASPDLRTIFTAWDDNSIKIWNTTGEIIRTIRGLKKPAEKIIITPDNKIVTADEENKLDVWSMGGRLLGSINGNRAVDCFTVSPVDSQIFTGLPDYHITTWDSAGNFLRTFKAHDNQITALAVTPIGNNILSASKDKTLKIWSLGGKAKFIYTNLAYEIKSIQVSTDSKFFLTESSDKTYQLWSMKGYITNKYNDDIATVCFTPNPGFLLVKKNNDTMSVRNYLGEIITNLNEIEDISEMKPFSTSANKNTGKYIVAKNANNKLIIFNARSYNYIKLLFDDKTFFFQDNFGYYDCPREIVKTTKIAKGFTLYDLEQYDKLFYRKNVFDYFLANKMLAKNNIEAVLDNQYVINIIEPIDNISVSTNSLNVGFTIDKQNFNPLDVLFSADKQIDLNNLYVKVNARTYKFKYTYKKITTTTTSTTKKGKSKTKTISKLVKIEPTSPYTMKVFLNHGNNAIYCGYIDSAKKIEIRSKKITIFNNK
jgi:WD40 repeat protein